MELNQLKLKIYRKAIVGVGDYMGRMKDFHECLNIVDEIEEKGGYDTVRIFLASVMYDNPVVFENVLDGSIQGETVREIIGE